MRELKFYFRLSTTLGYIKPPHHYCAVLGSKFLPTIQKITRVGVTPHPHPHTSIYIVQRLPCIYACRTCLLIQNEQGGGGDFYVPNLLWCCLAQLHRSLQSIESHCSDPRIPMFERSSNYTLVDQS